jgi:PAT family beta-lactamase induction signal transducer AmpG
MPRPKHSFKELVSNLLKVKKFRVVFALGISAGLPLMLVFSVVKIWLRRDGVDISTIGYFSWLTFPYSVNFCWAPLLDNIYSSKLGRRRGWIFLAQFGLSLSMILIGFFNPRTSLLGITLFTFLISFFSATQDIAIDAYRTEIMDDEEQGVGGSLYVYGYRIGMLLSSGVGLSLVDPKSLNITFNQLFQILGCLMFLLTFITYYADEPQVVKEKAKSFFDAVFVPFKEFFTRDFAFTIFFFVLLFKVGDGMASSVYSAYYVDMGFSNLEIGAITKGIGFFSTMAGLAIGASLMYMFGINKCLVGFGFMQAVSTGAFAILPKLMTILGSKTALGIIIGFEDFSSGLGTTAMVAFISSMADKRFTATQYALLASLAALGRTLFSGFSGKIVELTSSNPENLDYTFLFIFCALLAIPGLILARRIQTKLTV